MNEFNFKSYDTSKQSISYCEVDKCPSVIKLREQLDQLKAELEQEKNWHKTSDEISKTNSEYTAKLKAENEVLEKVNQKNQEKIKKLNETLEEEFIAKQYGDEALFFTLMNIKEIVKDFCSDCKENSDLHKLGDCKHCTYSRILQKISEVVDEI